VEPSPLLQRKNAKQRRETRRHVRLVEKIIQQLKKASPSSSRQTTAGLSVDIGDLFFVARRHQNDVNALLKMRFPNDREKFFNLLGQF
jgi:hypothetical protein